MAGDETTAAHAPAGRHPPAPGKHELPRRPLLILTGGKIALVVIRDDDVKFFPLTEKGTLEKLAELVPELPSKIGRFEKPKQEG